MRVDFFFCEFSAQVKDRLETISSGTSTHGTTASPHNPGVTLTDMTHRHGCRNKTPAVLVFSLVLVCQGLLDGSF